MKYFLTFLAQFVFLCNWAQNGIGVVTDIRVTGKLALSQLITEMQPDFSGGINEFNNQPGPGLGAEISKQLSMHWEIGAELVLSTLKGEAVNPVFSATGNHGAMTGPFTAPVLYKTRLFAKKVFAQYNFIIGNYNNTTNPFIRAGVGIVPYRSELRYKDNWTGLIFGKGVEEYDKYKVSTAVYTLTPGIRTKISKGMEFMAAVNLNMVNYDFLDVVHNYSDNGERQQLIGIFADFMMGITLRINDSGRFDIIKRKNRRGKINNYLPFYERY